MELNCLPALVTWDQSLQRNTWEPKSSHWSLHILLIKEEIRSGIISIFATKSIHHTLKLMQAPMVKVNCKHSLNNFWTRKANNMLGNRLTLLREVIFPSEIWERSNGSMQTKPNFQMQLWQWIEIFHVIFASRTHNLNGKFLDLSSTEKLGKG